MLSCSSTIRTLGLLNRRRESERSGVRFFFTSSKRVTRRLDCDESEVPSLIIGSSSMMVGCKDIIVEKHVRRNPGTCVNRAYASTAHIDRYSILRRGAQQCRAQSCLGLRKSGGCMSSGRPVYACDAYSDEYAVQGLPLHHDSLATFMVSHLFVDGRHGFFSSKILYNEEA